jgi:hypothetical protein
MRTSAGGLHYNAYNIYDTDLQKGNFEIMKSAAKF